MASYNHYEFNCIIHTRNASDYAVRKLKDLCCSLFAENREKRRSPKFWTNDIVAYYTNSLDLTGNGLIHFAISDADSVRSLKTIEGKLRKECDSTYSRVVKDIVCWHKKTK